MSFSAQPEEGQDEQHDDDKTDKIDYRIHGISFRSDPALPEGQGRGFHSTEP